MGTGGSNTRRPSFMLHTLLNAYWLRPETALWRACDIKAMQGFAMNAPSLDLGCGDGVFSFIRAEGRPSADFDVFSVSNIDRFFDNVDVYDAPGREAVDIARRPNYRISVGLDHKNNMLAKAKPLGLYDKLHEWDANTQLPFNDGSFNSVFSNVLYWLDNPFGAMLEIKRILRPGGSACLLLPDKLLGEYRLGIVELDRGRTGNIKHMRSDWANVIEDAGLVVMSHVEYLSKPIVQLWDIGLRPIFPALKAMADSVPSADRSSIKGRWVETCEKFMAPMLEKDSPGAFHCFVVSR
jgi:SAM-dependent methyltransferase